MDRAEFSKLLMERKGDEPVTQLSYKCQIAREVLAKILNGNVNYFVESAVKVARALNSIILIKREETRIELNNSATLTWWAQKSQQESGFSVNKFKDEIGLTRVAVTANLKGESKMRIDTLLKWAEVTGYEVELLNK